MEYTDFFSNKKENNKNNKNKNKKYKTSKSLNNNISQSNIQSELNKKTDNIEVIDTNNNNNNVKCLIQLCINEKVYYEKEVYDVFNYQIDFEEKFKDCCFYYHIGKYKKYLKYGDKLDLPLDFEGQNLRIYAYTPEEEFVLNYNELIYKGNSSCVILFNESFSDLQLYITSNTFSNITRLDLLALSKWVKNIDDDAFKNLEYVGEIIIANRNPAFDCRDDSNAIISTEFNKLLLTSSKTVLPDSITMLGDYCLTNKNMTQFSCNVDDNYPNHTNDLSTSNNISLKNIISIGNYCFQYSNKLESVTINDLSELGSNCFKDCISLKSIEVKKLTEISESCFENCKSLNVIKIIGFNKNEEELSTSFSYYNINSYKKKTEEDDEPTGPAYITKVRIIGKNAFKNCNSLNTVTLKNIDKIEEGAFENCTNLTSIIISNVKVLSKNTFKGCTRLKNVTITNVEKIEEGTFENCKNFENITIKDVKVLEKHAFNNCSKLGDITLINIKKIELNVFETCDGLKSLTLENIGVLENNIFENLTSLNSITAKDIKVISNNTFKGCTSLEWVSLDNVDTIKQHAFENCDSLKSIKLANIDVMEDSIFENLKSLSIVKISNLPVISKNSFRNCTSLFQVTLDKIVSIEESAFENCEHLYTLFSNEDEDGVKENTTYYFKDTRSGNGLLKPFPVSRVIKINKIKNIPSIGKNAFKNTGLKELKIENVDRIMNSAFEGCNSLKTINIDSVLEIYQNAFKNCSSLDSINLTNIDTIHDMAFEDCEALEEITLQNVNIISDNAFENYGNLKQISLSKSKKLGKSLINILDHIPTIKLCNESKLDLNFLKSNKNISEITLDNIDTIPGNFFSKIQNIKKINLRNINKIEKNAFQNCDKLQEVYLSDINRIESYAFESCNKLKVAHLASINKIQPFAFNNCKKLEKIYFEKDICLTNNTFNSCDNIDEIIISHSNDVNVWGSINFKKMLKGITNPSSITKLKFLHLNCKELICLKVFPNLNDVTFDNCINITSEIFNKCDNVKVLNLLNMDMIGNNLFKNGKSLEKVNIPNVLSIGSNAFKKCINLKSINCDKLLAVGDNAFSDCLLLEKIPLDYCIYIGKEAFKNCSSLTEVSLNQNVTIEEKAFFNCSELQNVTRSSKAFEINTFKTCDLVFKTCDFVVLSDSFTSYRKDDFSLFASKRESPKLNFNDMPYYDTFPFLNKIYSLIKSIIFYKYSFALNLDDRYLNSLTNVYIQDEANFINSFRDFINSNGCTTSENINSFDSTNEENAIDTNVLDYLLNNQVEIKDNKEVKDKPEKYWMFQNNKDFLLRCFENFLCLSNCNKDLYLPFFEYNSLLDFSKRAKFNYVDFKYNICRKSKFFLDFNYIGSYAFANCKKLEQVYLPDNLLHIKSYAFANCKSLNVLHANKVVYDISKTAFNKCKRLKQININNTICPCYLMEDGNLYCELWYILSYINIEFIITYFKNFTPKSDVEENAFLDTSLFPHDHYLTYDSHFTIETTFTTNVPNKILEGLDKYKKRNDLSPVISYFETSLWNEYFKYRGIFLEHREPNNPYVDFDSLHRTTSYDYDNSKSKCSTKFGRKCPICGSKLVVRTRNRDGKKFYGCSNFPQCRYTENYYKSDFLKCPRCGSRLEVKQRRSDGRKFYGCTNFPRCKYTKDYN